MQGKIIHPLCFAVYYCYAASLWIRNILNPIHIWFSNRCLIPTFSMGSVLKSICDHRGEENPTWLYILTLRGMKGSVAKVTLKLLPRNSRDTLSVAGAVMATLRVKKWIICCGKNAYVCSKSFAAVLCSQIFQVALVVHMLVHYTAFKLLTQNLPLCSLHRYESTSCTNEQIPSCVWPGGEKWPMLRWYPGVKGHMGQLLLCSQPQVCCLNYWSQRWRSFPRPPSSQGKCKVHHVLVVNATKTVRLTKGVGLFAFVFSVAHAA